MQYDFCKKCGNFHWDDQVCHCEPFLVYHPESMERLGDAVKSVYAENFKDAAARYIEGFYYEDPYDDVDSFNEIVVIKRGDVSKIFRCTAEHSIDFFAREIEEKDSSPS